jgi:hypothetical protein
VKHTVVLDEPLAMRWRKELVTRLILDHEKIIQVRD